MDNTNKSIKDSREVWTAQADLCDRCDSVHNLYTEIEYTDGTTEVVGNSCLWKYNPSSDKYDKQLPPAIPKKMSTKLLDLLREKK